MGGGGSGLINQSILRGTFLSPDIFVKGIPQVPEIMKIREIRRASGFSLVQDGVWKKYMELNKRTSLTFSNLSVKSWT